MKTKLISIAMALLLLLIPAACSADTGGTGNPSGTQNDDTAPSTTDAADAPDTTDSTQKTPKPDKGSPEPKENLDQQLLDSVTAITIAKNVCDFADSCMAGNGFLKDEAEKSTGFTLILESDAEWDFFGYVKKMSTRHELLDSNGEEVRSTRYCIKATDSYRVAVIVRVMGDVDITEFSFRIYSELGEGSSRAFPVSGEITPLDPSLVKTGEVFLGDLIEIEGRVYLPVLGNGYSTRTSGAGDGLSFAVGFIPFDSVTTHTLDYDKFTFRLNENSRASKKVSTVSIKAFPLHENEIGGYSLKRFYANAQIENEYEGAIGAATDIYTMYFVEYSGANFSLLLKRRDDS